MATMRHTPRGRGYDSALHYFHHMEDYWQNWFQNGNGDTNFFPSCKAKYPDVRPRDLWLANSTYEGPAFGFTNTSANCSVGVFDLCHDQTKCHPYPSINNVFEGEQSPGCTYVDETFASQAIEQVMEYKEGGDPLFIFWSWHTVHSPLQVPQEFYEKFNFIDDWRRRRYHAMVRNFAPRRSFSGHHLHSCLKCLFTLTST